MGGETMTILKKIQQTLKPLGYPAFAIARQGKPTSYITYFQYAERSAYVTDGKEHHPNYFVQVDVWTSDVTVYSDMSEKVKQAMIDAGFTKRSVQDFYDNEAQVYHKAMRFNYAQKLKL